MEKLLFIFIIIFCTKYAYSQEFMQYSCQYNRVNIFDFESSHSFDDKGIIMENKKYHPLAISRYGLLTYYYYLETLDSTFYHKCINQINYFKDSSKIDVLFDGKGIGLPYNFNFWDLKAPWYSGMTQGFAISFLLRYYKLTNDESILPIIKKIAFVLKLHQNKGGTISTTKEGCIWIEEYPNSKRAPQVLNGFINGLIGLYEYSTFFPEDTTAKRIFTEAYECLKKSLEFYDTPMWSYYDRNKKSLSNRYLWYQIYEMKHLYDLFQEPIFDHQMRLWAVMLHNKLEKEKSKKDQFINRYNSNPVKIMNDSLYHIPLQLNEFMTIDSSQIFIANTKREFRRYYKGKKVRNLKKQSDFSYFCFPNVIKDSVDYIEIKFNKPSLNISSISAYKKLGNNPKKAEEIELKKFHNENDVFLSFQKINISDFFIKVQTEIKLDILAVESNFFDTSKENIPYFAHYITEPVKLTQGVDYKINIPLYNTEKAVLFYKYASSNKMLNQTKWKAVNTLNMNDNFSPPENGNYIFMIIYNYNSVLSFNGRLKLKAISNNQ